MGLLRGYSFCCRGSNPPSPTSETLSPVRPSVRCGIPFLLSGFAASLRLPATNKDAAVMPRNSLLFTPSWLAIILSFGGDCSEEPKRNCFESLLLGVMAGPPVQLPQRAVSPKTIFFEHQNAAPLPSPLFLSSSNPAPLPPPPLGAPSPAPGP